MESHLLAMILIISTKLKILGELDGECEVLPIFRNRLGSVIMGFFLSLEWKGSEKIFHSFFCAIKLNVIYCIVNDILIEEMIKL